MRRLLKRFALSHSILGAALGLAAPAAYAQQLPPISGQQPNPLPAPPPSCCCPIPGSTPYSPGTGGTTTPSTGTTTAMAGGGTPDFGRAGTGAGVGDSASLGGGAYIDSAIPMSQFKLRYDAVYGNNRPDRAEFFYAKCGSGKIGGTGPVKGETNIDYQDISGYLELAHNNWLSGFVDVPFRFLNPEQNANTSGVADMWAGFKAALIASPDRYITFQFRTGIPTGNAHVGLGNDHVSLEPALLFWQRVTQCLTVQAELRDWIPVGGSDFEGNVLRYGFGAGYEVYNNGHTWVQPVVEFVGWEVLSGHESYLGQVQDSEGASIFNGKIGVRAGSGCQSIYAGYGRALTGDVWYKDTFRVEYRLAF